jgi:hypothetical protein
VIVLDGKRESELTKAVVLRQFRLQGILPINSLELGEKLAMMVSSREFRDLKPRVTFNELKIWYARFSGITIRGNPSKQKKD